MAPGWRNLSEYKSIWSPYRHFRLYLCRPDARPGVQLCRSSQMVPPAGNAMELNSHIIMNIDALRYRQEHNRPKDAWQIGTKTHPCTFCHCCCYRGANDSMSNETGLRSLRMINDVSRWRLVVVKMNSSSLTIRRDELCNKTRKKILN